MMHLSAGKAANQPSGRIGRYVLIYINFNRYAIVPFPSVKIMFLIFIRNLTRKFKNHNNIYNYIILYNNIYNIAPL